MWAAIVGHKESEWTQADLSPCRESKSNEIISKCHSMIENRLFMKILSTLFQTNKTFDEWAIGCKSYECHLIRIYDELIWDDNASLAVPLENPLRSAPFDESQPNTET